MQQTLIIIKQFLIMIEKFGMDLCFEGVHWARGDGRHYCILQHIDNRYRLEPWTVVGGNPTKFIKRELK